MNDLTGTGLVRFYYPSKDGSYMFVGSKFIRFKIDNTKSINVNFAEGIRSACFKGKESTKKNHIVYEFEDSVAICDIIVNSVGEYINRFPIILRDWKNYGVDDGQKNKNSKRKC